VTRATCPTCGGPVQRRWQGRPPVYCARRATMPRVVRELTVDEGANLLRDLGLAAAGPPRRHRTGRQSRPWLSAHLTHYKPDRAEFGSQVWLPGRQPGTSTCGNMAEASYAARMEPAYTAFCQSGRRVLHGLSRPTFGNAACASDQVSSGPNPVRAGRLSATTVDGTRWPDSRYASMRRVTLTSPTASASVQPSCARRQVSIQAASGSRFRCAVRLRYSGSHRRRGLSRSSIAAPGRSQRYRARPSASLGLSSLIGDLDRWHMRSAFGLGG
jgi:hypothetical protein